jgi:hypothetical protein
LGGAQALEKRRQKIKVRFKEQVILPYQNCYPLIPLVFSSGGIQIDMVQ